MQSQIRKEKDKGDDGLKGRLIHWFVYKYLHELKAINKQYLSDSVIDSLASYLMFLAKDDKFTVPEDALDALWGFAEFMNEKFIIEYPAIAISQRKKLIWICMTVLGANGREFTFGCTKFAEVISRHTGNKIHPTQISRELRTFELAGLMKTIKKGKKNGCSSIYMLSERYFNDYEVLGCTPIDNDTPPCYPDDIAERFPWWVKGES